MEGKFWCCHVLPYVCHHDAGFLLTEIACKRGGFIAGNVTMAGPYAWSCLNYGIEAAGLQSHHSRSGRLCEVSSACLHGSCLLSLPLHPGRIRSMVTHHCFKESWIVSEWANVFLAFLGNIWRPINSIHWLVESPMLIYIHYILVYGVESHFCRLCCSFHVWNPHPCWFHACCFTIYVWFMCAPFPAK